MKKKILGLCLVFAMVLGLAACGGSGDTTSDDAATTESKELTISAAASLKNAMGELTPMFEEANPGVKLTFNYGGSGDLQKQIEGGAPVDFFISAAAKQMNALEEGGFLDDATREDLMKNELVLIVPKGQTEIKSIEDLATDKASQVALGEPSAVPAGQYAEECLTSLGILDAVKAKVVYGKDVTQVLTYVENGEVVAGMVYKTDALSSDKVDIVTAAPADSYKTVIYPMAVLKDAANAEDAKKFEEFLKSDEAMKVFEEYGFSKLS